MRVRSSTSSRRWSGLSASTLPVHPMSRVVVSSTGAGMVFELGLEQLGHQVVGGMLGPPVDVLLECAGSDVDPREPLAGVRHGACFEPQALVDAISDGFLVLFGDAEKHADGAHR